MPLRKSHRRHAPLITMLGSPVGAAGWVVGRGQLVSASRTLLSGRLKQAWEWKGDRLGSETWDPLPESLHLDKPLLQQQNMKKLQGTENNCSHAQLGQL